MPISGSGEPVVVARATTSSEAELIVGFLRTAGVHAQVEDVQIAAYSTTVGGELRVIVRAAEAERARELLRNADHVDGADPGSDLDVGLPVDDDVREYLAWMGGISDRPVEGPHDYPPSLPSAMAPTPAAYGLEDVHARGLPVLPLLGLIVVVVALVVLLR